MLTHSLVVPYTLMQHFEKYVCLSFGIPFDRYCVRAKETSITLQKLVVVAGGGINPFVSQFRSQSCAKIVVNQTL